jgi:hypothetical protein
VSTTATRTEVLDKLVKAQALLERAATQGEAEAAAAALTRLMVKHGLEMADLEQHTTTAEERSGRYAQHRIDMKGNSWWRRDLAKYISQYNLCSYFFYRGVGGSLGRGAGTIIGEPDNVKVVIDLYTALQAMIERGSRKAWDELADMQMFYTRTKWANSYRAGCVSGIVDALREAHQAAQDEVPGGSELVVLKEAELEAAVQRLAPDVKITTVKAKRVIGSAYGKGHADGKAFHGQASRKQVAA